jgi:hypothetical protein
MARTVLWILCCMSVMSLVSGCYCYPPGYYPGSYHHGYRYSSLYPAPSYAQHVGGAPHGL